MGDWLVRHVTIFGIHGQNWMLITFAIIVIWIALSWWSVGGLFHIKPSPRCRLLAVRPEGANHLWRKNPPRELSIDLVADERLGRVTGRAGAS
jgi:hypothetical protein